MKSLIILLICFPLVANAQVFDDFSDGDFSRNPTWLGDISDFKVNADAQLQLDSEGEEISHLLTAFSMNQETEWRFWIKMPFSPSANNYGRFYLAVDQSDLEGSLNGYFLQFGESGSGDAIELFRQNGDELTSICRGAEAYISSSFQLWMRVRKNQQGNWTVEADESGNGNYQFQASGTDQLILTSLYLGVFCKYTSSNSTKFYFDDIYAGPFVEDNEPPELVQLDVVDATMLDLLFNEALDATSAGNIHNYTVSNQIGNPIQATPNIENPALVRLIFDREFPNGLTLTLNIENIRDVSGNLAETIVQDFAFFTPFAFDVQINEVMADPNPPVEMPDWEYVELYNRTEIPIDLSGWKLIIGATVKEIENVSIQAGGYLILGDEDAAPEFTFSGPFYGFSSFALTNAGQTLVLQNVQGAVISAVSYSDEWYRDANKDEGGWSLEQIDPENPCGGKDNWAVCVNQYGGTPGAENSVRAENPDLTPPSTQRIEILDSITLMLYFSEPMDSILLFNKSAYAVDQNIENPEIVNPVWPHYQSVQMSFGQAFRESIVYNLQITGELTDCVGNVMEDTSPVSFGLPGQAVEGDVAINEILFNPKDDNVKGVDFVEIYNRSDKIIDLGKMLLATEDKETGAIVSPKPISESGFLFFPGQYMVLTTKPGIVQTQYYTENTNAFIKMASLPSYSNDAGIVIIATNGFMIIDKVVYNESMQYPLLTTFDGVSLERLNYDRASNDETNWHSAAEDVGFATPGYENSQFGEILESVDPITLKPEIFSPDSDGRDDVLNIHYQFEKAGTNCNISIYDSRGRLVRTLVNNEYVGTSGQFSWDGLNDNHQKAAIGIYMVFVETFDVDGNRKNYKKTAVLATQL